MKIFFLIIIAIIVVVFILMIIAIIYHSFNPQKNFHEGSVCTIFSGADRIYDCTIIYRSGNWVVARDLFGICYVRHINECYYQIL